MRFHCAHHQPKVVVLIPEVPGFVGNVKDEKAIRTILAGQYRTINRGGNSIYEEIRKAGYEPSAPQTFSLFLLADGKGYRMNFIKFYHLRAYDRLNAPYGRYHNNGTSAALIPHPLSETYLKDAEMQSGVSFYQAQVAQAREWIGDGWQDGPAREFKIFEAKGNVGAGLQLEGDAKKSDTEVKTLPLPQDRQEAKRTVDGFENAAKNVLDGSYVSDNVGQHAMKGAGHLSEERWFGTEDEERNWYANPSPRQS